MLLTLRQKLILKVMQELGGTASRPMIFADERIQDCMTEGKMISLMGFMVKSGHVLKSGQWFRINAEVNG